MRKDAPLAIEVPSADRDTPGWVKVGVIAAIGFVVGIAWPRVMGVRLGPSAPGEASSAAAASAAQPHGSSRAVEAPPASVAAKASSSSQPSASSAAAGPSASAMASAAPSGPPQVSVQRGAVLVCKTDDGESKKGRECGSIAALDTVVQPRLKKVATCAAAEGQTGKLSFVVTADFASGRLGWDVGKSSTVGNVDGLTTCLKTIFLGVALGGVAHENPRYTVAYTAILAPPHEVAEGKADKVDAKGDKPAVDAKTDGAKVKPDEGDGKTESPAAAGEGTVAWEVALVRDVPKTGQVVARLPRGTRVKVGATKEGWFAIKYGDAFASDGWVYRAALGK